MSSIEEVVSPQDGLSTSFRLITCVSVPKDRDGRNAVRREDGSERTPKPEVKRRTRKSELGCANYDARGARDGRSLYRAAAQAADKRDRAMLLKSSCKCARHA